MTYEVERRGVGVCALQAAGERFEAERTANGAEGVPAEGWGVVLRDPRREGIGGVCVCGLRKGGGPEDEGL
jgi:hypothetical protein